MPEAKKKPWERDWGNASPETTKKPWERDWNATPEEKPAQQEKPGFFSRAYDASIGGLVDTASMVGKRLSENPEQLGDPFSRIGDAASRPIVEMSSALAQRYKENPTKSNNPLVRGVDAFYGPVVDLVQEDIKSGNYLGALGTAAGGVFGMKAPQVLGKAKALVQRPVKAAIRAYGPSINAYAPESKMGSAVAWANQEGLPLTVGEQLNNPAMMKTERAGEALPGASDVTSEFYRKRVSDVQQKVNSKIDQYSAKARATAKNSKGTLLGEAEDTTGAGELVRDRVLGRSSDIKKISDKNYDAVRDTVEQNRKKLQTAQDQTYAKEVAAVEKRNRIKTESEQYRRDLLINGGMDPALIPDTVTLEPIPKKPPPVIGAEVKMAPIRAKLRSLYEEMNKTMAQTQRDASPGYSTLRALVEDTDAVKSAIDLDRDLGSIKRVVRNETKGYSNTQSGRYAMATIDALEGQVLKAIEKAGGTKAVDKLLKGRIATKTMHAANEALDDLLPKGESTANLYNRALTAGDTKINELNKLKKIAPTAVEELAATHLQKSLEKVSGEGGAASFTPARNHWNRIGDRTKIALYGEKVAAEMDALFENAPQLIYNMNPSGTAAASQAMGLLKKFGSLGAGGATLGSTVGSAIAGPIGGTVGAGVGALTLPAAEMSARNAIARFMLKPGNATKVRNVMRFANEPNAAKYYSGILSKAIQATPGLEALLNENRDEAPKE